MEKLDKIPFFFILGRPRSGTTLLRTLFDAHPNVQIPPECKFILDLYPKYGKKTNWSEKELEGFYQDLIRQWRFNIWTIDREKLKAGLMACAGKTSYSMICKVVYHHYQSFYEKKEILWFGDKNPGYTIYTERLLKIFPDAKFIQILRDYRDNYVSVKDVDFELPVPSLVATKWKLFYKNVRRAAGKNPERYLTIRYEDLVDDPEKQMKPVCAFLGIDYRPEMLEFHRKEDEIFKVYPKAFVMRFHANLVNKINKSRSGIWKEKLSRNEIRLADMAVGKIAEEAGYQRQFDRFGFLLYLQALPGITLAHVLAVLTVIIDKFPYNARMLILNRGPIAVAKTFLRLFKPKKYREIRDRMK